jgi:hypothetical protein
VCVCVCVCYFTLGLNRGSPLLRLPVLCEDGVDRLKGFVDLLSCLCSRDNHLAAAQCEKRWVVSISSVTHTIYHILPKETENT